MRTTLLLIALAVLASGLLFGGTEAEGATLRVPQDHATITAAIAAAGSNDEAGTPIGSHMNFLLAVPVELSTFQLH